MYWFIHSIIWSSNYSSNFVVVVCIRLTKRRSSCDSLWMCRRDYWIIISFWLIINPSSFSPQAPYHFVPASYPAQLRPVNSANSFDEFSKKFSSMSLGSQGSTQSDGKGRFQFWVLCSSLSEADAGVICQQNIHSTKTCACLPKASILISHIKEAKIIKDVIF